VINVNRKKLFAGIGLCVGTLALALGLIIGNSGISLSDSNDKYLAKEYSVRDSVKSTFDLGNQKYKSLFLRDVFDDSIATENDEVRSKLVLCYNMLLQDKEIKEGDFKPVFFLDGNEKVFIAVSHPDNIITLTEFDISKDKPEKVDKQVKEAK
jgi:hypothetical protein